MLLNSTRSQNIHETIKELKYPAETGRHIATILGFPSICSLPSSHHSVACSEIIGLAVAVSHFEPVRLYTRPEEISLAQSMLSNTTRGSYEIEIIPFATNHLWVRDTGPVYVQGATTKSEKQRVAIHFGFNEWGRKGVAEGWPRMTADQIQENHTFAKQVTDSDSDSSSLISITSKVCLEGGALVSDGDGTLIVSESSIIGDKRNPGVSKDEIEEELRWLLGVKKIIWFSGFRDLDITDVHADAEVQFVRPGVVVISRPHASARKEWHEVYQQVLDVLRGELDARGRQFEIHTIDEPNPKLVLTSGLGYEEDPATNYVNFYYVNGGVILPKFGDEEMDRKALETMQKLHPDRIVRQLHVNALPLTGGVIHCATQPVIEVR
ncbi:porphyromonas-type peptidyl-arginine deiminase superfamily [Penicillium waksmanii]|uniref:porphyromonas-type peptidyl-arginine deiminase superfamily n=1 Tax=Penicillium waksmanii TaxID=69791 RepID=UPI002547CAE7|nr:porphyromonas-type peptidyl-arginine deiminase superfamily [Penicillium waksmanii]KAJ5966626.1 porphyromonas-type peptidyl-arginine deiminase superfamily [Penicillium waksmanii]